MIVNTLTVDDMDAIVLASLDLNDKLSDQGQDVVQFLEKQLKAYLIFCLATRVMEDVSPVEVMVSASSVFATKMFEAGYRYGLEVKDVGAHD